MASREKQRGVYVVFLAGAVIGLLLIFAVVAGSAFLSINKARQINAMNSASLGAIERFVRLQPSPPATEATYLERANAAVARANEILAGQGSLLSMGGSVKLGELAYGSPGAGGLVTFGRWHPEPEDPSVIPRPPCPSSTHPDYPCFVPVDPPTLASGHPLVNAVKISGKTPASFTIPFADMLGGGGTGFATESISAVVPRCTVLALDISISATSESHKVWVSYTANDPMLPATACPGGVCTLPCDTSGTTYTDHKPHMPLCPRDVSRFAFNLPGINPRNGLAASPFSPCERDNDALYTTFEGRVWCNMAWVNRGTAGPKYRCRGPACLPDPSFTEGYAPTNPHRPDDYGYTVTPYGPVLIDYYTLPQPLTIFLGAFNSAIQMLRAQSSLSDRVVGIAFNRAIADQYPAEGKGFAKTSAELGYLQQITYADNFRPTSATESAIQPNFVTRGWFPLVTNPNEGTNVVALLHKAQQLLANPALCPPSAQKSVILATDGASSCSRNGCPSTTLDYDPIRWSYYRDAERDLLVGANSYLEQFKKNRIALTVLLGGEGIGMNFMNRKKNGKWINFSDAHVNGFSGLPPVHEIDSDEWGTLSENSFVDYRSCCSNPSCNCATSDCPCGGDMNAFLHLGEPGYVFRRPIGVFTEFALQTGGMMCQLMSPGSESDYLGASHHSRYLTDAYRDAIGENSRITVAPEYLPGGRGDYAAKCAQLTLGLNPFIQVKEE